MSIAINSETESQDEPVAKRVSRILKSFEKEITTHGETSRLLFDLIQPNSIVEVLGLLPETYRK